jgi:hypothetical protein
MISHARNQAVSCAAKTPPAPPPLDLVARNVQNPQPTLAPPQRIVGQRTGEPRKAAIDPIGHYIRFKADEIRRTRQASVLIAQASCSAVPNLIEERCYLRGRFTNVIGTDEFLLRAIAPGCTNSRYSVLPTRVDIMNAIANYHRL